MKNGRSLVLYMAESGSTDITLSSSLVTDKVSEGQTLDNTAPTPVPSLHTLPVLSSLSPAETSHNPLRRVAVIGAY